MTLIAGQRSLFELLDDCAPVPAARDVDMEIACGVVAWFRWLGTLVEQEERRLQDKARRAARRAALRQTSLLSVSNDPRVATLVKDPPEIQGWREDVGMPLPRRSECRTDPKACPWCGEKTIMWAVPVDRVMEWHEQSQRPDRVALRLAGGDQKGVVGGGERGDVAVLVRLRRRKGCDTNEPDARQHDMLRLPEPEPRAESHTRVWGMESDDPAVHEPEGRPMDGLRRSRDSGCGTMDGEGRLPSVPGGHGAQADGGALPGSQGGERRLRTEQLPVGNGEGAEQEHPTIACPHCWGRVRYRRRVVGEDWDWEKYDHGASQSRLEPREGGVGAAAVGLSRCRPCVRVTCRHHLLLDMHDDGVEGDGVEPALVLNSAGAAPVPGRRPEMSAAEEADEFVSRALDRLGKLRHTCALDLAEAGEQTEETVAEALGVSVESIRLATLSAVGKIRRWAEEGGYGNDGDMTDAIEAALFGAGE